MMFELAISLRVGRHLYGLLFHPLHWHFGQAGNDTIIGPLMIFSIGCLSFSVADTSLALWEGL